jgi:hypothetical protein
MADLPISSTPADPSQLPTTASEAAIGSATDAPIESITTHDPAAVNIVLIIPATGKRHTYKIDKGYLDRRQVTVTDGDPFNLTVYGMKELILRDWKEEWVPKPTAPTFIRLILMGRELDDKATLKGMDRKCQLDEDRALLTLHYRMPYPRRRTKRCAYDDSAHRSSRRRRRHREEGLVETRFAECRPTGLLQLCHFIGAIHSGDLGTFAWWGRLFSLPFWRGFFQFRDGLRSSVFLSFPAFCQFV